MSVDYVSIADCVRAVDCKQGGRHSHTSQHDQYDCTSFDELCCTQLEAKNASCNDRRNIRKQPQLLTRSRVTKYTTGLEYKPQCAVGVYPFAPNATAHERVKNRLCVGLLFRMIRTHSLRFLN